LKAILLAGGLGTRAKPFTDYCPKALIPVNGQPVIDHIVRYLSRFSLISEIIIVCEFDSFGKQIMNYFEGKDEIIGKIITFIEDKKNGTGGSLLQCEEKIGDDSSFLVWFSDNLCAININKFAAAYAEVIKKNKDQTIGLITILTKSHEEKGRVILHDGSNNNSVSLIKEFVEKPFITLQYPEAAGIYIFNHRLLDLLHEKSREKNSESFDLSGDILQRIHFNGKDRIFSYTIDSINTEWIDVESPAHLERNRKTVSSIVSQMKSVT
jgi:mannose-1-phosphate guanylyltransferase